MTEWRAVPGRDDYQVSDTGEVRSLARKVPSTRHASGYKSVRERVLKPFSDGHGYETVTLPGFGKVKVHRLVAAAFHGPCPEGSEVRHIDGNCRNNAASNLAYGSRAQNVADAIRHGTFSRGQKNGAAKLNDVAVAEIKRAILFGARTCHLARQYGVSEQAISDIRAGRNWAHIQARGA